MKKIKLMPDYECCPLWHNSGEEYGDIDPDTLPISNILKKELMDWAKWFDGILNQDDPANSGFKSSEDEVAFIKEGDRLYEKLEEELGDDYEVKWSSRRYGVREGNKKIRIVSGYPTNTPKNPKGGKIVISYEELDQYILSVIDDLAGQDELRKIILL